MIKDLTTIDFETLPIEPRPDYPPSPVGVAVGVPGKPVVYHAWGHRGGGNGVTYVEGGRCRHDRDVEATARAAVAAALNRGPVLFYNAKFDLEVITQRWGMLMPSWDRVHDAMFLAFLDAPDERRVGLKPTAHRLLNVPPDEREVVTDWLMEHQPVPGVKIKRSTAGAHIAYAPADVVAPYAIGDVTRTRDVFNLLHPGSSPRG